MKALYVRKKSQICSIKLYFLPAKITFKEINKLAIPAIAAGIAEPIISLTDIAVVGNMQSHAVEALAAAGIVGSFLSAIIWIVDRKSTRLNSSHVASSYAVFCLKKKISRVTSR